MIAYASDRKTVYLKHRQTADDAVTISQDANKLALYAKYTSKMPTDVPHLLYAALRRFWLEEQLCPVHAACLELADGRGILLVGNSGVGKTSTAINFVLDHGARLFSGDKTIVEFSGDQMHAIGGTKVITLREHDRIKWPQIPEHKVKYKPGRFMFDLESDQYCNKDKLKIDAIYLLLPHAIFKKFAADNAAHTLLPYFLDASRADVIIGDTLYNGNVSGETKNLIRKGLVESLALLPVYQLSISAGSLVDNILGTLQGQNRRAHSSRL